MNPHDLLLGVVVQSVTPTIFSPLSSPAVLSC